MFSYPRIVRLAPVLFLIIMAAGLAETLIQGGGYDDSTIFIGAASIALALALFFRTRVELGAHEITVVRPWTSRRIQRDEIAAVNWERGSDVVLSLRAGGHVSLPSITGRDAEMSAAIHAWLHG